MLGSLFLGFLIFQLENRVTLFLFACLIVVWSFILVEKGWSLKGDSKGEKGVVAVLIVVMYLFKSTSCTV